MKNRLNSIVIICLLVIGGFVGLINFESENAQGTDVSGIIYDGSGGPWTLFGSPYIVVGDVIVPAGLTLTIEPGVQVRFDGRYGIYVGGNLLAIGTQASIIVITSNLAMPDEGDWESIQINSTGYAEIKYSDISYGGYAISLLGSSNNSITNNTISLISTNSISLDISSNNNITGNNIFLNTGSGINLWESSNNNITNNYVISNKGHGIRLRKSSNNNITNNNIDSNGAFGIHLRESSNNTVTNNKLYNDGIFIGGNQLSHYNSHTIPDNNMVNDNPLYYYKDSSVINIDGIPVGQLILVNCSDVNAKNLQMEYTDVGIEIAYSTNINITNINFTDNFFCIYLISSSNNTITNTYISDNWNGIVLDLSPDNVIMNNNISWNYFCAVVIRSSSNNNIMNNNIFNNNDGIYLDSSNNNLIKANNASNNWHGIRLHSSSNNDIIGNIASSNTGPLITGYGIFLYSSSNNRITNNIASSNDWKGIGLEEGSSDNIITNNNVSNNEYGIYMESSSNNRIYHNNIINNTNQAYDDMNDNFWNDSYPSGGNYWSDYTGIDLNNTPNQNVPPPDGIGDTPYVIDPDSQDYYPLMEPFQRTEPPLLPPILYINVSSDGKDIILNWEPQTIQEFDPYLIYRSTDPTNFDFSTPWVNSLTDKELGESSPIPDRTMWNDTNAASMENTTNYKEQYYYVMRAFNGVGEVGSNSRTVGKWTKTFPEDISTFSLPLEPIEQMDTDYYTSSMNADYIKYIDPVNHTWTQHNFGDGITNNTEMKQGEGYEVKFGSQTNYTFTGLPGAMISYDNDTGFEGFNYSSNGKNLTVSIEPNGNVTLSWQEPASMGPGDWYEVYYSNTRDGFFSILGNGYDLACPSLGFGTNTTTITGLGANDPGTRLYFMVVPFNSFGIKGVSTYSIGIWTEEFLLGYDTFGIPLKLDTYYSVDWYCDNIQNTVGINYFIYSQQRWSWHPTLIPQGAFDPSLEMTEGYQISSSDPTKFTFIGI